MPELVAFDLGAGSFRFEPGVEPGEDDVLPEQALRRAQHVHGFGRDRREFAQAICSSFSASRKSRGANSVRPRMVRASPS